MQRTLATLLTVALLTGCNDAVQPTDQPSHSVVQGSLTSKVWMNVTGRLDYVGTFSQELALRNDNGKITPVVKGPAKVIDRPTKLLQAQSGEVDSPPSSGLNASGNGNLQGVERAENVRVSRTLVQKRDGKTVRIEFADDKKAPAGPPSLMFVSIDGQPTAFYRFERSLKYGKWVTDGVETSVLDKGGNVKAKIKTDLRGLTQNNLSLLENFECKVKGRLATAANVATRIIGVKPLYADDSGKCFAEQLYLTGALIAEGIAWSFAQTAEAACLAAFEPLLSCTGWITAQAAWLAADVAVVAANDALQRCLHPDPVYHTAYGTYANGDSRGGNGYCIITIRSVSYDGGVTWTVTSTSVRCYDEDGNPV